MKAIKSCYKCRIAQVHKNHDLSMRGKGCSSIGCKNKIEEGAIETVVGWFCSEKCRKKVQERIFRVLAFPE